MAEVQDAILPIPHSSVLISTNYLKITSLPNLSNDWIYSEGWGYAPFINISIMSSDSSLFMELSAYFNAQGEDGVIPRILTLPCFPELTYLMLQKGHRYIFLNNSKMLSVFPPFAVGSSWPRWDFSWKNLSALAPVSSERSQPRVFFHIPVQSAQPSGILTKALLNAHFVLFEMCPAHSTVLGSSTPLSHRGERAISNGLSQWEKPKFLLLIKGQIHSPASAGTSWQWG